MEILEVFLEDDGGEEWSSPVHHMIAGSVAGMAEHCAAFPLDTIKTHLQSHKPAGGTTFVTTLSHILRTNGYRGLFHGIAAAAAGAGPAHALHFAVYEFCKRNFGGNKSGHHPFASATSAVMAAVVSEGLMTPCDSLKQKMQLNQHTGLLRCARDTYNTLGLRKGFYAGYTTTLTMNAPYAAIQFATYESFKTLLAGHDAEQRQKTVFHLLAGGAGGALAAAATNPLDVARTRLQTQHQIEYKGMVHAMTRITTEEGVRGLCTGIGTRMIFHSVSSAITWVTYEYMKYLLADSHSV